MKKRIIKRFEYSLAGFPVAVENVEVVKTQEGEFPLLDYEELDRRILVALATKKTKLTGNQVRFIRHAFELSLREFSKLFRFTAPSVLKWEQRCNESTSMEWPSELLLRTEVLLRFADEETAMRNWQSLKEQPLPGTPKDEHIRIASCPPAHVAEVPSATFEGVWPKLSEFTSTGFSLCTTEVTNTTHYGTGSFGDDSGQSGKRNASDAFTNAA